MEPKAPHANCSECTLKDARFVPTYVPEEARVAILGEGPGAQEAKYGIPFVSNSDVKRLGEKGRGGQSAILLEARFNREGVPYEEVWRSNVVCCRPPGNRTPSRLEQKCCSDRLTNELLEWTENSPRTRVIIPFGKTAADALLPHTADFKITERRGHWFGAHNVPVMPTWHPAYVLRRPSEAKNLYDDIHRALTGSPDHPLQTAPNVIHVDTVPKLHEMITAIPYGASVAWDLETDQVNWYDKPEYERDVILMMGLTWQIGESYIIHPDILDSTIGQAQLVSMFDIEGLEFVAHNGKFDVIFMRANGVPNAKCDWDTMLAHYALWEETGYHGLKQLALRYYGLPDYEGPLVQKYLKSRNDYYSKVPYDNLAQYCAWDCCVTLQLRWDLEKAMIEDDVYEQPFKKIFMPAQTALTEVEWRGVPIDLEHVHEWEERILDYCDKLEDEMQRIADTPLLNPRSPMQVAQVLYVDRKLPRPRARGVKPNSTAKKALAHIKPGQDEFVDTLRTYRRAHKMNRSYLKNLREFAGLDGRVHPSAFIHGTEVGRLSFRNPAIQTIPRPYEDLYGAMVRSAFKAPEGWRFILADYSQAELRVAAILANEPFLLDVYKNDRDLHSEVAIAMYGENFTKAHRVICKMFNFSYLYGGSEYSFAEDSGLPIHIARQFVHDYDSVMPRLAEWKAEQFHKLRTDGYVVSPFGRKRRCLLVTHGNINDVRKAAAHAPVAGTASDLTLLSLNELVRRGRDVVLTVHDSIGALAREAEAEEVGTEMKTVMEGIATSYFPQLPWKVDVDIRSRWAPIPEEIYGDQVRATFG